MKKFGLLILITLGMAAAPLRGAVLLVADEFPAMEVLAARLEAEENISCKLVSQQELPAKLAEYQTVAVYIHGALSAAAEDAFIKYARNGGKLVLLHHSISSGKRKNAHWFNFLGVSLPEGDLAHGGYKWIEGVSFDLVNLNPTHFIMTNRVKYPEQIDYSSTNAPAGAGTALPAFRLEATEVYLNHVHTEPRTLLMGLKYVDAQGKTYLQDTAGWVKPAGNGWVIYLMPGHTKKDFENPVYGRLVLNAIVWQPERDRPRAQH